MFGKSGSREANFVNESITLKSDRSRRSNKPTTIIKFHVNTFSLVMVNGCMKINQIFIR